MKYGFFCILSLMLVFGAYQTAQNKLNNALDLTVLRLGMSVKELEKHFGTPSAKSHNQFTYILEDGSELSVTLRDKKISSANVKFRQPLKIQDPEMRKLTLVQMETHNTQTNRASWFFAGNPAEGLIYKVSTKGRIESLTWVPPFTYGNNQPKHLQALLRDFQSQNLSSL